jgi:short-chain fatty acids transporter
LRATLLTNTRFSSRVTGPLILQYPLYGGIMGILVSTGLADVVAKAFIQFANAHTLPFWNYVASLLISLFVPSAGGHWAVQGPFAVPAVMGFTVMSFFDGNGSLWCSSVLLA